jgi:hypothetical protein
MGKDFVGWLKELKRDKRHLVINSGWGIPERELYFYTKEEVEEKWGNEIPFNICGSLIDTYHLYSDINLTCSLFPWNYIIVEFAGPAMGDAKRKAFISNRTLLLHYITTGTLELDNRDKSLDKSIFPEGVDPLHDTMVFIPQETYNNIIKDKEKTFGNGVSLC